MTPHSADVQPSCSQLNRRHPRPLALDKRRPYDDGVDSKGALIMKRAVRVAASILFLASCNKSPEVHEKDASVAEVAKKVREAGADQSFVRPGLWQSKVTIEKFEVPGMPQEMATRMRTMMAQNQEHGFQSCLTAEDVKKPKEDFFAGKDNECRYDGFTMGGGKIDAVMHCGKGQTMKMAGTYAPDSYSMQTSMTAAADKGDEASGMQMQMRIEAQRVGECAAKQG
jgi:hypothetical protein